MTNEQAIRIVAEMTSENTKEDVVAKTFAYEDILEDDVMRWVSVPTAVHLHQFIDHNNRLASRFIDEKCDIYGYDEGVKIEMHSLRDKMESVMKIMIKYVAIHEAITKKSVSER